MLCIGCFVGVNAYQAWDSSIVNTTQIKVAQVLYGYDAFSGQHTTNVYGYNGQENLEFWGDQTALFKPSHEYIIVFHGEYRGIPPFIKAWDILNITEINDTIPS